MCASMEEKLSGIGKGDIDYTWRRRERAKAPVEVSSQGVGCVCCKGRKDEGRFLGQNGVKLLQSANACKVSRGSTNLCWGLV